MDILLAITLTLNKADFQSLMPIANTCEPKDCRDEFPEDREPGAPAE